MHEKKLYGTATIGTKGQVVIPVEARYELGLHPGDRLYVVGSSNKGFIGLLKEDTLEHFLEQVNLQLENLKSIKNPKDK